MRKNIQSRALSRPAFLCLLAGASACLITGCWRKSPEKIDLGSTQAATTAAETMASDTKDTEADISIEETEGRPADSAGQAGGQTSGSQNKYTTMNTYTSGQVSIQYPAIGDIPGADKAALDKLLKDNALAILDAYEINDGEDSVKIECRVLSADRNRITVVYTGSLAKKEAAYPLSVFYTNTVDVGNVSSIGLSRYADPYTMAGYVLSDDCRFSSVSPELEAQLRTAKNDYTLEEYTKMFTDADFPVEGEFPQVFSYEYLGDIYFSIPVPHALGDYALVVFAPENK